MSSYAYGCMIVVIPIEHIGEFERLFDQDYEKSFLNTEIKLTDIEDAGIAGHQKRIYDFSCNTSLEACLIENEDYDIGDVCFELGIVELDIDAINIEEDFNESIKFDKNEGICHYDSVEQKWRKTSYDLNL